MSTKTLYKVGDNQGRGSFEVVDVDGVVELRVNGTKIDTTSAATIAALTAVSTADGSDAATTQALANALKVKVNAIITAIQA
jgi:hypothetical protein